MRAMASSRELISSRRIIDQDVDTRTMASRSRTVVAFSSLGGMARANSDATNDSGAWRSISATRQGPR